MEAASFLQHEATAAPWVVKVWVWGLPTRCSHGENSQFSCHRTHHCLHVYLGVSQAVFAIKGRALAPGGSSSCLSTAARSWGRFGTPDENGKAKATFQKLRGTRLWGKNGALQRGQVQSSQRFGCPNLLPFPNTPKQNMALGFLPRPREWDGCCSPLLCLESEEH